MRLYIDLFQKKKKIFCHVLSEFKYYKSLYISTDLIITVRHDFSKDHEDKVSLFMDSTG